MIPQLILVLADLAQQEIKKRGLTMTQYTQEHADLQVFYELIANAVTEESESLLKLKESLDQTTEASVDTGELIKELLSLLGTQSASIINVENGQSLLDQKLTDLVAELKTLHEKVGSNKEFTTVIINALNESTDKNKEHLNTLVEAIQSVKDANNENTKSELSEFDQIREELKLLDRTNDFTSITEKVDTLIELVERVETLIVDKEDSYSSRMENLNMIFTNTSKSLEGVMSRLDDLDVSVKELSARVQATSVKVNASTDAEAALQAIKDTLN